MGASASTAGLGPSYRGAQREYPPSTSYSITAMRCASSPVSAPATMPATSALRAASASGSRNRLRAIAMPSTASTKSAIRISLASVTSRTVGIGNLTAPSGFPYHRYMADLVIRGATIVDGTGAPARTGDVAVQDGVITEVAGGRGGESRRSATRATAS